MKSYRKVCLECAEGGHLDEMIEILPSLDGFDFFFITSQSDTTERLAKRFRVYYVSKSDLRPSSRYYVIARDMAMSVVVAVRTLRIILRERPLVVISTGGGATVQLCVIARLLGIKVLALQSITRVTSLSVTGRLVYPLSNVFVVQWSQLLKEYPRAKYWGRVL